jgi:transposase InsO family protein
VTGSNPEGRKSMSENMTTAAAPEDPDPAKEVRQSNEGTDNAANTPDAETTSRPTPVEPASQPDSVPPSVNDATRHDGGIPSGFLRLRAPGDAPTDTGATPPPPPKKKRKAKTPDTKARALTPVERLNLLDIWQRSGLVAPEFAGLVGLNKHTLYGWKKKFKEEGPAGLEDKPRAGGSKLSDLTRRTILMIKKEHPEYGCERISFLLLRGPALAASPGTVAKVLQDAGYVLSEEPTHKHREFVRRFERARPNQLWQTDLFTFLLKRQNVRVYLVGFMDDHSRFIVGYGLHMSQSAALTLEVLRASIGSYGRPEEVLTDNGTQYVTWRGKGAFTKELEKRGIKQIVSSPRHPQTLGKIERFWGSLWREFIEAAVFLDLADARKRIGLWIDHYNFQRPHQALEGLVPADRFFDAASEVKKTLEARVAANALDLACNGVPRKPFYLTGQANGEPFSIHAEGERLILSKSGQREEIVLGRRQTGERILDAVARLGTGPGRTVVITKLRRELADVSRPEFDATLRALERGGAVALGRALDLATLTEEDRAAAMEDPVRGQILYVSGIGEPWVQDGPGADLPTAVCPDGSPEGVLPEEPEVEGEGEGEENAT